MFVDCQSHVAPYTQALPNTLHTCSCSRCIYTVITLCVTTYSEVAAVKGMGQPTPLFMSSFTLFTLLTPANVLCPLSCTSWSLAVPRGLCGGCCVGSCVGGLCEPLPPVGPAPSHQLPPVQPIQALLADFFLTHSCDSSARASSSTFAGRVGQFTSGVGHLTFLLFY